MKPAPILTKTEALILIAFGIVLMLAGPALAQTVLTINGQCVPTTCGSAPPTPPTCTGGQVLVNNVCVCPSGLAWNGSSCVTPTPPPAGCPIVDAPAQLGGNPPIPPTVMAATQKVAYRIPHSMLDGKSVGAYQPSYGMSVAISNVPCDFGPGTPTQTGCYINLAPLVNTQILVRVGTANGYMVCAKPAPDASGNLYVNFSWSVYPNYGKPLGNYCAEQGNISCSYQFRRDV